MRPGLDSATAVPRWKLVAGLDLRPVSGLLRHRGWRIGVNQPPRAGQLLAKSATGFFSSPDKGPRSPAGSACCRWKGSGIGLLQGAIIATDSDEIGRAEGCEVSVWPGLRLDARRTASARSLEALTDPTRSGAGRVEIVRRIGPPAPACRQPTSCQEAQFLGGSPKSPLRRQAFVQDSKEIAWDDLSGNGIRRNSPRHGEGSHVWRTQGRSPRGL